MFATNELHLNLSGVRLGYDRLLNVPIPVIGALRSNGESGLSTVIRRVIHECRLWETTPFTARCMKDRDAGQNYHSLAVFT